MSGRLPEAEEAAAEYAPGWANSVDHPAFDPARISNPLATRETRLGPSGPTAARKLMIEERR